MQHYTTVPNTNRRIYDVLFIIETSLRELIIETLSAGNTIAWISSLPRDIADKCAKGRLAERSKHWTTHVDHHPIYYLDFPDLTKAINAKWSTHFASLLPDQEIFRAELKALEPIRNKIAHNRKASDADLRHAEGTLALLTSSLGQDRIHDLASRCTTAPPLAEAIAALATEADNASTVITHISHPFALKAWPAIKTQWWFNSDYLLGPLEVHERTQLEDAQAFHIARLEDINRRLAKVPEAPLTSSTDSQEDPLQPIHALFDLYERYSALPRGMGQGHAIEQWVKMNSVLSTHDLCRATFDKLTKELSNG